MRRVLVLAGVIVVALLLESTVLAGVRLGGARPDLLVIAVVAVAMAAGPTSAACFGFSAGLLADLLFARPVGVSALVYTSLGYAVGVGRVYLVGSRTWVHLLLTGAASLAAVWSAGLVLRVLDLSSWAYVARTGPLVALYNLLLAPVVYPLVRRLAADTAPERIYRWQGG
jgi:rod shape-determining protein MreD